MTLGLLAVLIDVALDARPHLFRQRHPRIGVGHQHRRGPAQHDLVREEPPRVGLLEPDRAGEHVDRGGVRVADEADPRQLQAQRVQQRLHRGMARAGRIHLGRGQPGLHVSIAQVRADPSAPGPDRMPRARSPLR